MTNKRRFLPNFPIKPIIIKINPNCQIAEFWSINNLIINHAAPGTQIYCKTIKILLMNYGRVL